MLVWARQGGRRKMGLIRAETEWRRSARDLAVLGVLAAVSICALGRGARLVRQETQTAVWAEIPGGTRTGGAAGAPATAGPAADALRRHRPRQHTPPTWQEKREWARVEVRSLCRDARRMARALEGRGDLPFEIPRGAVEEAAKELGPPLVRAAQQGARVEAELDRARGSDDLHATYREIASIRNAVNDVRPWFRAQWMSARSGPGREHGGRPRAAPLSVARSEGPNAPLSRSSGRPRPGS